MKLIEFVDGEVLSISNFFERLEASEVEMKLFFSFVIENNIARRLVGGRLSIGFVGAVSAYGISIWCEPKTVSIGNLIAHKGRASVLSAIFKHRSELKNGSRRRRSEDFGVQVPDGLDKAEESGNFEFVLTCLQVIEDYLKSGLFRSKVYVSELGLAGEVDWERTFDEAIAFMSASGTAYLDVYSLVTKEDINSLIRLIHNEILTLSTLWIYKFGLNSIYGTDSSLPMQRDPNLTDMLDGSYYLDIIENAIKTEMNDTQKHKLLLMARFLRMASGVSNETLVLGTRAFHSVWESVCASIFDNRLSLEKSGVEIQECVDLAPAIITYPRDFYPRWTLSSSGMMSTPSDTSLVPDVISTNMSTDGVLNFLIIDAKYYDARKSLPGASDVSKQTLYEIGLHDVVQGFDAWRIVNTFVVPSMYSSARVVGCVELPFLSKYSSSCIRLLEIPLYSAINDYLANKINAFLPSILERECSNHG